MYNNVYLHICVSVCIYIYMFSFVPLGFYFAFPKTERFQSYHQYLCENRFYVNIGCGVIIGCDRCF